MRVWVPPRRRLAVVAVLFGRPHRGSDAGTTAAVVAAKTTAAAAAADPAVAGLPRRQDGRSSLRFWGEEENTGVDDEEEIRRRASRPPPGSHSLPVGGRQQRVTATRRDEEGSDGEAAPPEHYEVVVIGAGWAGLGAARTLLQSTESLLVLEGRNYVGGRSRTVRFRDGTPVELGSGWVHGASSANVIYQVVQESGMEVVASSDTVNYWSNAYQDDSPHPVNADDVEPLVEALTDGFHEFLDRYPDDDDKATDGPLEDAALEYEQQEGISGDTELVFDLALDSGIVAEYAASLEDLSRWYWDEDGEPIEGGDALVGGDGYSGAVDWYASQFKDKIRLGANVTDVDWSDPAGTVAVRYAQDDGNVRIVTAQKVIVTVPLGVLKRGAITFTPDLPQAKLDAIDRLGMGLLNKCIMRWSSNATLPWPADLGWLERIAPLGEQGQWTEFFSLERDTKHKVLIAWSAGREADRVEQLNDNEIKAEVKAALAAMFGEGTVPMPEEWIMSRWRADPWSSGSYSYHAVGSGPDDRKALAEPVDDRLFFAGEATHLQYMSTTHGALSSGITAGTMVQASLAVGPESAAGTIKCACVAMTTLASTLWWFIVS